jgi:hypothetical protein
MSKPYASGSVAGVSLSVGGDDCKALILDGANLWLQRAITNTVALDGTVYTQTVNLSGKGQRFGVRIEFIPPDVLGDIVDAIAAAVDGNTPFNVTLEDDLHSVDTDCVPDGSDWLKYPEQRTNETTIKGVTMRFLTA